MRRSIRVANLVTEFGPPDPFRPVKQELTTEDAPRFPVLEGPPGQPRHAEKAIANP